MERLQRAEYVAMSDVEGFASWCSSDEEGCTVTRHRPGVRFVPTFADLVDRRCRFFWIETESGNVAWSAERPEDGSGLRVVVEVAYRSAENADCTASSVWDSAVVLARHVIANHGELRVDRAIELGAGCGLVGLCFSQASGRPCTLTDLPGCLPRLRSNVRLNSSLVGLVSVDALEWVASGSVLAEGERVLVLAADCLLPYKPELMESLATTIASFVAGHAESVALVAYEERCDVQVFFQALQARKMAWKVLQKWDRDSLWLVEIRRI